jgi:hypothetical protein
VNTDKKQDANDKKEPGFWSASRIYPAAAV